MRTRSGKGIEVLEELSERPVPVVRKKRVSKVLSSKNWKAVAGDDMKGEGPEYRISYDANRMNPHWCMEVRGLAFLPFLSCIETVKLFTENYPEIRQIKREGGRFIFETSIAANENLKTPENLRTRLQQFCVNASQVSRIDCAPKVSQILWTR